MGSCVVVLRLGVDEKRMEGFYGVLVFGFPSCESVVRTNRTLLLRKLPLMVIQARNQSVLCTPSSSHLCGAARHPRARRVVEIVGF